MIKKLINGTFVQKMLRSVLFWAAAVTAVCTAAVFMYFRFAPFSELETFIQRRQYSSRFYDCRGALVDVLALEQGLRREWIPLESIPPHVRSSFIEAEDKNFYRHPGIDLSAVIRSAYLNAKFKTNVSGASTITMQLARLIIPRESNYVSMSDKIREAAAALKIESRLSKDEILELYLNNVPFGYQTEGLASAARNFFNTQVNRLTFEQSSILANIPRRPSSYTGVKRAYSYTNDVQQSVQHFVLYVKAQYAAEGKIIPSEVHLSIDSELTAAAADEMLRQTELYDAMRVSNGACLVIENRTGRIIVWAGSADMSGEAAFGMIDGIRVKNQFGSAMKPFLYARALECGFAPSSILPDIPTDFGTEKVYVPQNFNNRYNGPVLFRRALASSLNIPAVYLLYRIGMDNYFSVLEQLGFHSLKGQRDSTGLSLALGSCEVTLEEMVRAFSVFARGGTLPSLKYLHQENAEEKGYQVFSHDTASIICSMLSDRKSRATGFGNARVFDTPYQSIFKTGTSNQFQDIAAFGSTPSYTAGCWFGNHDGSTVKKVTGSTIPAHVVRSVLDYLENTDRDVITSNMSVSFPLPHDFVYEEICPLSGMKAGESCPSTVKEFVLLGKKLETCDLHSFEEGRLTTSYPEMYRFWLDNAAADSFDVCSDELTIMYPADGAVFLFDSALPHATQSVRVDVSGGSGEYAELKVNGISAGEIKRPFLWNVPLKTGRHILEVNCDGSSSSVTIDVR